jgi:hypothetical protein
MDLRSTLRTMCLVKVFSRTKNLVNVQSGHQVLYLMAVLVLASILIIWRFGGLVDCAHDMAGAPVPRLVYVLFESPSGARLAFRRYVIASTIICVVDAVTYL